MMVWNSLAWERRKSVASTGTELLPIILASLSLYLTGMMMSPAIVFLVNIVAVKNRFLVSYAL